MSGGGKGGNEGDGVVVQWLERRLVTAEVAGSNPVNPVFGEWNQGPAPVPLRERGHLL